MTKKHYDAIASIIRNSYLDDEFWDEGGIQTQMDIAIKLADYFATDNPKFNRTRFLEACGIETK